MKKESFETPWFLRENSPEQTVDQLEKIAQQDPKKANLISKAFDKVLQFTNNLLGQKPQQTENTAQVSQQADLIQDQIMQLKKLGDLTNAKKVETFLNNFYQQVQQVGFQQRVGLRQDLAKAINLIAGKVTNTLEALEQHYKQQAKQGDAISVKSSPGEEAMRKEISDILRGMIESYRDQQKDPKASENFENLILNFLKDSIKGIVPLKQIVDAGSGDVKNEVLKTKYKTLVDIGLIDQLLSKKPAGTGGNWGPGELGLAILGSPVMKGDTGDIIVGGEKIEIKASATATQGGRITPDALIGEGQDGKQEYTKALNEFLKSTKLNRFVKPDGDYINFQKVTQKGKVSKKRTKYTNFGRTLFRDIINTSIDKMPGKKINKGASEMFVKKSIIAAFKSEYKKDVAKLLQLKNSISAEGKIDFDGVMAEYIKVLGYFYNKQKGVKKILVINPSDGHFEVISTENPKGIAEKLQTGVLQTGATAIDFNLTQQKPSPQIGTQKGGRQKKF